MSAKPEELREGMGVEVSVPVTGEIVRVGYDEGIDTRFWVRIPALGNKEVCYFASEITVTDAPEPDADA